MKKSTKAKIDIDSFRKDIINNEKFEVFKSRHKIMTREKLDIQLLELMRLDGKFYEYKPDPVVRSKSVYKSNDGFIKISPRKVKEFESALGVEKLELADIRLDGNQIIIEVKTS